MTALCPTGCACRVCAPPLYDGRDDAGASVEERELFALRARVARLERERADVRHVLQAVMRSPHEVSIPALAAWVEKLGGET